ncbi:small acidic protein [Aplysia californica]|uniref:Small acidic protein n=1 Tax=Aplysia californica TaxID=6500 RepID=A0ABM0JBT7_APLCA|nr:small acidic protein [Aplysia californica]
MSSAGPGKEDKNKKDADAVTSTVTEVHSANSWETADLGDSQRHQKFLRLMGASKKEHHGRFVIGDNSSSQTRTKNDTGQLNEELVEQYEQSMEHRLAGGRRGHLGLGYHPDDNEEKKENDEEKKQKDEEVREVRGEADGAADSDSGKDSIGSGSDEDSNGKTEKKEGESAASKHKDESSGDGGDRKRESSDKSSDTQEKKLKFVKSSS